MIVDKHFDNTPDFEISYKKEPSTVKNLMHYHDGYELVLYVECDIECFVKNYNYKIVDSSLLFISPYDMHTFNYTLGTTYTRYVMYFHENFIQSILESQEIKNIINRLNNLQSQQITLNADTFIKISGLFSTMFKYSEDPKFPSNIKNVILKNYLSILLIEFSSLFSNNDTSPLPLQSKSSKLVYDIISYIDKSYANDITLDAIKDMLFIDKFYMCHLFKKTTGISIVDYIQKRRIIESQKLLINSDLSVIQICYDCGFNNLQHFYRIFKKHTNNTPAQYKAPYEHYKSSQ